MDIEGYSLELSLDITKHEDPCPLQVPPKFGSGSYARFTDLPPDRVPAYVDFPSKLDLQSQSAASA